MLTVFIVATGVALDRAFHESARSAREERLQGQVYLLIGAADVDAQGRLTMPASLSEARFSVPGSGLYGTIADANKVLIWNSQSALDVELPPATILAPGEHQFGERNNRSGRPFFAYALGINWA